MKDLSNMTRSLENVSHGLVPIDERKPRKTFMETVYKGEK